MHCCKRITKDTVSDQRLLTVHKIDKKYFFEKQYESSIKKSTFKINDYEEDYDDRCYLGTTAGQLKCNHSDCAEITSFIGETKYYLNYLSLHKEEEVFAEFLQNSYSESLDTCERAINNLDTNDLEPFYQRKLEIFIELIDGSFGSWYNNNTKQVNNFIDEISGKYSNNIPILKRLYRLLCIIDKEHEANILLNKLENNKM